MSRKRRVHSATFKGKVALEALKELKPINMLASQYEVQPNQISTWKKQLKEGLPDIFNTDQGVQFTSRQFTQPLTDVDVKISMDGKGRALDNIFVERLWRTVKHENIYLKDYQNGSELYHGLEEYFSFYNTRRPHQSLGYKSPEDIHFS